MQQAHIFFTGMVQGVGFRYTTQSYAKHLNLKGWVKNLPDGSVEAVIQAEKSEVAELCAQLKRHFGEYIKEIQETWEEATTELPDFQIRH